MKNGDTILTFYNISDSQLREINAQLSADSELTAVKQELEQLKKELKSEQANHAETRRRLEEQSETKLSAENELTEVKQKLKSEQEKHAETRRRLEEQSETMLSAENELTEVKQKLKSEQEKSAVNKENIGGLVTIFILLAIYVGLVFLRQSVNDPSMTGFVIVSVILSLFPAGALFIISSVFDNFGFMDYWIDNIGLGFFPGATAISSTIIMFGFPLATYPWRGFCCGVSFVLAVAMLFLLFFSGKELLIDEDIAVNIMGIVSVVLAAALFITADLTRRELYTDKWFLLIGFIGMAIIGLILLILSVEEYDSILLNAVSTITLIFCIGMAIFDIASYDFITEIASKII